MSYKKVTIDNYNLEIFDDIFLYDYRLFLYTFCLKSHYKIGWEDTYEVENAHYKYLHSRWNEDDFKRIDFIKQISRNEKLLKFTEIYETKKYVANLSYPNAVYFAHTHGEEKVLLYYANMQWKQEWAGETLFFDESGKEVVYTSTYTPGRIIIFDGKMPHTIRPQSSAAPHFRFTISTFWSSK